MNFEKERRAIRTSSLALDLLLVAGVKIEVFS
jgi:hypothetical protein